MADGNGVPRWVYERFEGVDKRIDSLEARQDRRLSVIEEQLGVTRLQVAKLLGVLAIVSTLIGGMSGALVTAIMKAITK